MELSTKERVERLEMAIALMQDADCMMQAALGDTDSCYDTHCGIEDLIEDLRADIEDLKVRDAE